MAKSVLTSDGLRAGSSAYATLYDKGGLQVYALKGGRFEIKCGTTRTYAHSMSEVSDKIDALELHQFASSGQEVLATINQNFGQQFRLEIKAAKRVGGEGEEQVFSVEGNKTHIADKMTGTTNLNIAEMVPGRRYAMQTNMYGGDYAILVPMCMGMLPEASPSAEAPMYEKQPFAKGMVLEGIDPVSGNLFTCVVADAYPNGSFTDSMGKVFSSDDAELYQLCVAQPSVAEDNFKEPDEPLYESSNIPSYNPIGVVKEQAPQAYDLANYDAILSASAGVLHDFMKTAKKVAYLDRSSLNKVTVTAINDKGQATDGEIEWNIRIGSPHYKRSSQITVPMVMVKGSVDIGKEFITSTGHRFPLTVESLQTHLGTLAQDDLYRKASKETSDRFPSTVKADKDVDNLLNGIERKAYTEDGSDITPMAQKVMDINENIWQSNGWQDRSDVDMNVLGDAMKEIAPQVTPADIEVLTDYNLHAAVECIENIQKTSSKKTGSSFEAAVKARTKYILDNREKFPDYVSNKAKEFYKSMTQNGTEEEIVAQQVREDDEFAEAVAEVGARGGKVPKSVIEMPTRVEASKKTAASDIRWIITDKDTGEIVSDGDSEGEAWSSARSVADQLGISDHLLESDEYYTNDFDVKIINKKLKLVPKNKASKKTAGQKVWFSVQDETEQESKDLKSFDNKDDAEQFQDEFDRTNPDRMSALYEWTSDENGENAQYRVIGSKKTADNLEEKSVEELEVLIDNWMDAMAHMSDALSTKPEQMMVGNRIREAEAILQRKKKEAAASKKTAAPSLRQNQVQMMADSFVRNILMYKEEIDKGALTVEERAQEILDEATFEGFPQFSDMNRQQISDLVQKKLSEAGIQKADIESALVALEMGFEGLNTKAFSTGAAVVKTASAGPHTLLTQIAEDLQAGKLEDDSYLKLVGHGMGHTQGADLTVGTPASDIMFALIGYEAGHTSKEETLKVIKNNIEQALADNDPFKGMTAQDPGIYELWMKEMDARNKGSQTAAKKADMSPESLAKSIARGDTFSLSRVTDANRQQITEALQKMGHAPEKIEELLTPKGELAVAAKDGEKPHTVPLSHSVDVEQLPNKNLKLTLVGDDAADELKQAAESQGDEGALVSGLEHWFGNGYELIAPEEVGALTDSLIIGYDTDRDDQGKLLKAPQVWWFPNYQVESPLQTLLEKGEVIFTYAEDREAPKAGVTKKIAGDEFDQWFEKKKEPSTDKKTEDKTSTKQAALSDWAALKDAIMSSQTQEEAVKKLKDAGYTPDFIPSGSDKVEAVEETVARLWDNYKEAYDPSKPDNKAAAAMDKAIAEYAAKFEGETEPAGAPDYYISERTGEPQDKPEGATYAVWILDTVRNNQGFDYLRDDIEAAVQAALDEDEEKAEELMDQLRDGGFDFGDYDQDLESALPDNIGVDYSGDGDTWVVYRKDIEPPEEPEEPEGKAEASKKTAKSPKGWEKTVEKMKKHPEIDNPFALSRWMEKEGYEPKKGSVAVAAPKKKVTPESQAPVQKVALIYEINKMTQKDSLEHGVTGQTTDFGTIHKGVAWTVDELFQEIEGVTNIEKKDFVVFEDGRLTGNVAEDNDSNPVSGEEEVKRLDAEGRLYLSDYDIYIQLGDGSEPTVERLVGLLGISDYDAQFSVGQPPHSGKHGSLKGSRPFVR